VSVSAVRRLDHPIVTPASHPSLGGNINGPSLIRTPEWLPGRLGRYYLYFAHHQGRFIRLAYADALTGPWRIHEPGTLQLTQTRFADHIASPDVHVDHDRRRIVMYYHGCCNDDPAIPWSQITCWAESHDGLAFVSRDEPLCGSYLRMFVWRGRHYGIAMPGSVFTSDDGVSGFRPGPDLRDDLCHPHRFKGEQRKARHFALQLTGDTLRVYFSRSGDCPEHILRSEVMLGDDWMTWRASPPVSVLRPEREWEGASAPHVPSRGGAIHVPAWQLRDPAIYEEDGRTYLLYSVAGEQGLGIAELV
jgi:hypothetical protein